jgi:hypothetical protein
MMDHVLFRARAGGRSSITEDEAGRQPLVVLHQARLAYLPG